MKYFSDFAQLFLRLAMGIGYLVPGLDRLGVWGRPGEKNISWGDWQHFVHYAEDVMSFLPTSMASVLAVVATIAEISFGAMLVTGAMTRVAAIGSAILALSFALSMTISFGIVSPLSYSVFTVSAASFLLASVKQYRWGIDDILARRKNTISF